MIRRRCLDLTFDNAREIIRASEAPFWRGRGTFHVSEEGREDTTHYFVYAGSREEIVEGRMEFTNFAAFARFVSKVSGDVTMMPMISALDRIAGMRKVLAST